MNNNSKDHTHLIYFGKFAPEGLAYVSRDGFVPLTARGVMQAKRADRVVNGSVTWEEARRIAERNREAVKRAFAALEDWRVREAR